MAWHVFCFWRQLLSLSDLDLDALCSFFLAYELGSQIDFPGTFATLGVHSCGQEAENKKSGE